MYGPSPLDAIANFSNNGLRKQCKTTISIQKIVLGKIGYWLWMKILDNDVYVSMKR